MNFFFLRMVLALAVFAVFSLTANAQAPYPNQGIRFIVPYAPGGLPDTVARIVGQHLQERIGQSVVIENRASGGAVLAVGALMGAPADGYTFLVTDGGILSTNPALFKQLSYNPKDIIPLALLGRAPNLVELGVFSVMWSEHCSYKSTRAHLRKLPTKAPWVL